MTSSPPSVESADDLEAAVEKILWGYGVSFKSKEATVKIIELIAAERKAREDHDIAVKAELDDTADWKLPEAIRCIKGSIRYSKDDVMMQEAIAWIEQSIAKLKSDSQPKQEREPA